MKILIIKKFHIKRTVKRWTRKSKVRLFFFWDGGSMLCWNLLLLINAAIMLPQHGKPSNSSFSKNSMIDITIVLHKSLKF
jgi:hypothetical protein